MKKIIIDTDIGDDIDDALALSMAIHSPELELVGVTTVGSKPENRARIARKLLDINGYTGVPVIAGAEYPLNGVWEEDHIPFQYGPEMEDAKLVQGESAEEFLIRAVGENPGEITVIAIGALTNVAKAIRDSESFRRNVKEIILMGGVYTYHYRECNIVCDPEAACIVFESGLPITAVGLEVSVKCHITVADSIAILENNRNAPSSFLAELIRRWDAVGVGRPIILFDLITLAVLIDSKMLRLEEKLVKVETKGIYTRGMTYCYETPFGEALPQKANVKVCMDIDVEKFMNLYCERSLIRRK